MPKIRYADPDFAGLPPGEHPFGVLTLERTVLLPGTVKEYHSVDPAHWQLLLDATQARRLLVACPGGSDGLDEVGVLARVVDVQRASATRVRFDLLGLARVRIGDVVYHEGAYPVARVQRVADKPESEDRAGALVQSIRASLQQLADQGYEIAAYALEQALGMRAPGLVADMLGATALDATEDRRALLREVDVEARLGMVDAALSDLLRASDAIYPTSRDRMN